jgi:hypothetical protein
VTSCDRIGAGDQGATAHERATHAATEQGNLVGELAIGGISAAHNTATATAQHGLVGCLQQLRHTGRAYVQMGISNTFYTVRFNIVTFYMVKIYMNTFYTVVFYTVTKCAQSLFIWSNII